MNGYRENFTSFFHWFAWSIACTASLFFAVFVIGEGIPDMLAGKGKDLIILLPGLLIGMAGCILTFFRKIPGGALMTLGGLIVVGAIYFLGEPIDYRMMIIYGVPYIFPGILFIFVRK